MSQPLVISTLTKLKQQLLDREILRPDQIGVIEEEQQKSSEAFDEICVRLGFLPSPLIKQMQSQITGIPYVDLQNIFPRRFFDVDIQKKLHFVVFNKVQDVVSVAMTDPEDLRLRDLIERQLTDYLGSNLTVEFFYADKAAIDKCFTSDASEGPDVTSLFDAILKKAISLQASDVHFQATQHLIQVRMRVDGLLRTVRELHSDIWPNLVIRIKILANIDIAESRRPQSGHFDGIFDTQKFDFRVSTHPTIFGESVVIRVLHKNKQIMSLDKLGIPEAISTNLQDIIERPYGLFLLCGPTGSGKTTTLYALCSLMDAQTRNIMTLEEPVEYQMESVRQTEIQRNGVISFADGVRSILRQDPDVIFIGEIRDEETANITLRAAMSGHLVLSTIHSNDALRAPNRLLDLGIKAPLLSGQILAVMSQRLVRCVCRQCGGSGCGDCDEGYKGRTAVCELMRVNDKIDECISLQKPIGELLQEAKNNGYVPMLEDGMQKVRNGTTTLDELTRALGWLGNLA
jgi:general secretion pathway protein E/type IV pilus assembly protein PilB